MKGKAMALTAALVALAGFGAPAAASCESDCFQEYMNCVADPNDGIPAPACQVLYNQCLRQCQFLRSDDTAAVIDARREISLTCHTQRASALKLPKAES